MGIVDTNLLRSAAVLMDRQAFDMVMDVADELEHLRAENERFRQALGAAKGYLLNAKIDLETGATKKTAINTIEGGLKMIAAALSDEPANG